MKVIPLPELLFRLSVREQWFMKNCIQCSDPVPHVRIGENLFFDPDKVNEWFLSRM